MVKVFPENKQICKVIIERPKFTQALQIVKSMPVRSYKNKAWSIPIFDLMLLKQKLTKTWIDLKVHKDVKDLYNSTIKLHKHLSLLKELDRQKDFYEKMNMLKLDLYPFQTVGAYFLYLAENCLLGDNVGLGKTIMALAVAMKRYLDNDINSVIIICPSTLAENWDNEIIKFTDRTHQLIGGAKSKRQRQYRLAHKFDFNIIPYSLLDRDWELIGKSILSKGFRFMLIMDEVQYVKNAKAKRTKRTRELVDFAQYKIGLSATSLENRVLELFDIYQSIDLTVFGDHYKKFVDQYCKLDWAGNIESAKNISTIRERMNAKIIRRFKEDVRDQLPDVIETNFWVDLSKEQRYIYNDIKNQIAETINDPNKEDKIRNATVLSLLTYLRQACLSSMLCGHEKNISTKTDILEEFMESLDDKSKVIIFSHFTKMCDLLGESFDKWNIPHIMIHGKNCKVTERMSIIDSFNQTPFIKALITSDILREGVNIQSANYVVNFDLLWNPALMLQRQGRIDRIDTKHKKLHVVNIMAKNTIEVKMFELLEKKKNEANQILDGGRQEERIKIKEVLNMLEMF